MPTTGRHRSELHVAALVGCLLLAFAVFAWGLHAKLSLYGPSVEPSNATVAKLLIGQRPQAMVGSASDLHAAPHGTWELILLLVGTTLLFPELQVRWIAASHHRVKGTDCAVPLAALSRPPPDIHPTR